MRYVGLIAFMTTPQSAQVDADVKQRCVQVYEQACAKLNIPVGVVTVREVNPPSGPQWKISGHHMTMEVEQSDLWCQFMSISPDAVKLVRPESATPDMVAEATARALFGQKFDDYKLDYEYPSSAGDMFYTWVHCAGSHSDFRRVSVRVDLETNTPTMIFAERPLAAPTNRVLLSEKQAYQLAVDAYNQREIGPGEVIRPFQLVVLGRDEVMNGEDERRTSQTNRLFYHFRVFLPGFSDRSRSGTKVKYINVYVDATTGKVAPIWKPGPFLGQESELKPIVEPPRISGEVQISRRNQTQTVVGSSATITSAPAQVTGTKVGLQVGSRLIPALYDANRNRLFVQQQGKTFAYVPNGKLTVALRKVTDRAAPIR